MINIEIETIDGTPYNLKLEELTALSWSSHYGAEGGGFGYCRLTLARQIGRNYPDIGYNYRLKIRKYLATILFDGQMRQIEEVSSAQGDTITITALGWVNVAEDEEIFKIYCDGRLSKWHPHSETPTVLFRPDLFATGINKVGFYINPGTSEILTNGYTDVVYTFEPDEEIARRFKGKISSSLGFGVLSDGDIAAIVNGTTIDAAMDVTLAFTFTNRILWNLTKNESRIILSVSAPGVGSHRFGLDADISSWLIGDDLGVFGPFWQAQIQNIVNDIITFFNVVGSIASPGNYPIYNLTKKSVATVLVNNGSSVQMSDVADISDWQIDDFIYIGSHLFYAFVVSANSGTGECVFASGVGERIVSSSIDWVVYNQDKNLVATIASWDIPNSKFFVTVPADLTGWANLDFIVITSPYAIRVLDSNDIPLWPTDWRFGTVRQYKTDLSLLTSGTPNGLKITYTSYIAGTGNDSFFVIFENLSACSTIENPTPDFLGREVVTTLSLPGHNLNSNTSAIEDLSARVYEPMVFEFKTLKDALTEVCESGDENLDPIAWGVKLDDTKTFYMERQDRTTVSYIIRRTGGASISSAGDFQETVQKVRGVWTDILGNQKFTTWYTYIPTFTVDPDQPYRARYVKLDNILTMTDANNWVQVYLEDNQKPAPKTGYQLQGGAIFTPYGVPIPFDQVKATGRMLEIEDWRNIESSSLGQALSNSWAKEQIIAVEVDYFSQSITLTPGGAKKTFDKYMAELARLASVS